MKRKYKWYIIIIIFVGVLTFVFLPRGLDGIYHFKECLCSEPYYFLFHDGKSYIGHGFNDELQYVGDYESGIVRDKCVWKIGNDDPIVLNAYVSLIGIIGYDSGFCQRLSGYEKAVDCLDRHGFIDLNVTLPCKLQQWD